MGEGKHLPLARLKRLMGGNLAIIQQGEGRRAGDGKCRILMKLERGAPEGDLNRNRIMRITDKAIGQRHREGVCRTAGGDALMALAMAGAALKGGEGSGLENGQRHSVTPPAPGLSACRHPG